MKDEDLNCVTVLFRKRNEKGRVGPWEAKPFIMNVLLTLDNSSQIVSKLHVVMITTPEGTIPTWWQTSVQGKIKIEPFCFLCFCMLHRPAKIWCSIRNNWKNNSHILSLILSQCSSNINIKITNEEYRCPHANHIRILGSIKRVKTISLTAFIPNISQIKCNFQGTFLESFPFTWCESSDISIATYVCNWNTHDYVQYFNHIFSILPSFQIVLRAKCSTL
jgi:hypothetical protein